jgi:uncharacterized protein YecE (DUF72 family)
VIDTSTWCPLPNLSICNLPTCHRTPTNPWTLNPSTLDLKNIHIGTSGFSFPDWKHVFYPAHLPATKMLEYYATQFDTVEINASYYRIPSRATFEAMARRTQDTFTFMVKVHGDVTHTRRSEVATVRASMTALHSSTNPLREAAKLRGFLAQFPYAFRNRQSEREYLLRLKELAAEVPLFVEFRHSGWVVPAVATFLRTNQIGYVCVDEPALSRLMPAQELVTTDVGYVRLHGRNAEAWWGSAEGDGHNSGRYDYSYSEAQISEWIIRVSGMLTKSSSLYLYFNNCVRGQAATNALLMKLNVALRLQKAED